MPRPLPVHPAGDEWARAEGAQNNRNSIPVIMAIQIKNGLWVEVAVRVFRLAQEAPGGWAMPFALGLCVCGVIILRCFLCGVIPRVGADSCAVRNSFLELHLVSHGPQSRESALTLILGLHHGGHPPEMEGWGLSTQCGDSFGGRAAKSIMSLLTSPPTRKLNEFLTSSPASADTTPDGGVVAEYHGLLARMDAIGMQDRAVFHDDSATD